MAGYSHSHGGHRERMREKYLAGGMDALAEHEILEILLFYAIKQRNVNNLAHELLRNTSLGKLAFESLESITDRPGIGERSALLVSLALTAARRYTDARVIRRLCLGNFVASSSVAKGLLYGQRTQKLIMICLNARCGMVGWTVLAEGNVTEDAIDEQAIIETAIKYRAHSVILAHNHLDNDATPDHEDILITQKIANALSAADIILWDHIVIGGKEAFGFSKNSLLIRESDLENQESEQLFAAASSKKIVIDSKHNNPQGEYSIYNPNY